MLKLKVDYPSDEEEMQILKRMGTSNGDIFMKSIVNPKTILNARAIVNEIYTDEKIEKYIVDLVLATRSPERFGLGEISELISYGASPRATIYLAQASRARAFLQKRGYVIPEDVRYIAEDILRHRLILTYEAEAEEVTTEDLIQRLFDTIPVP
jgi:MoxR-like ATPase